MDKKTLLVAEHIDKRFGITHAVNDVSLTIAAGEIRGLIGENGSGKSTFCQMLCGIYTIGGGVFTLDGEELHIRNQVDANNAGIAIIVQEMGTLSGLNAASQEANPADELAFQIARTMEKIAMQVEYTLINGVYVKANADNVANKTRGILAAIPASNTIDLQSTDQAPVALTYDTVAEALALIHDQGGDTTDVILGVNATTLLQLNWDARKNNMTIVPLGRNVNGLAIDTVITALGTVAVTLIDSLPDGTALLFNPNVCAPVFQPVPEKGNFFLEPLAKTGAADKYQIFGQLGLDHGPSFYHAKITGITTKKPSELSE